MRLKFMVAACAAFGSLAFGAGVSQAMPLQNTVASGSPSLIVKVAEGCGRGWHRGPYGRCFPNRPRPRICPPGWHITPWGECVPNHRRPPLCPPHHHLNRHGFCVPNWR